MTCQKKSSSTCKLFADDCKLHGIVNSTDQNKLQQDLINLERWSELWQLPFNSSKCKVMHFEHQNPRHQYYLSDQTLDETDREKELGVIIQYTRRSNNNDTIQNHGKASLRIRQHHMRSTLSNGYQGIGVNPTESNKVGIFFERDGL